MYLEYRSFDDMNKLLLKNISLFPRNIDLIVGIPRSGMLPANLLALYLNKPFTDIDSFLDKRIYSSGERKMAVNTSDVRNILVIDDSVYSGNALGKVKMKLMHLNIEFSIQYAVVFATTLSKKMVDYYCEIIDAPRIFQWNLFHHSLINN